MSRQITAGEVVAHAAPRYTPEHDSLTWLVPTGHLHGPKKASTRYLSSVTRQSVEKTATLLDFTTPALVGQIVPVKRSLKKGLRRMFNRRRNLVILMAYRTLDVLLDSTVNGTAVEQFTIEQGGGQHSSPEKARIRCQDLASSRTNCLVPLNPLFVGRSKLPTRNVETFYCFLAKSAEKMKS